MAYFIYKITQSPGAFVKKLEKINQLPSFKEAKKQVRVLREESPDLQQEGEYKVIFADNELEAEERLQEKRDAPIVMEWEK